MSASLGQAILSLARAAVMSTMKLWLAVGCCACLFAFPSAGAAKTSEFMGGTLVPGRGIIVNVPGDRQPTQVFLGSKLMKIYPRLNRIGTDLVQNRDGSWTLDFDKTASTLVEIQIDKSLRVDQVVVGAPTFCMARPAKTCVRSPTGLSVIKRSYGSRVSPGTNGQSDELCAGPDALRLLTSSGGRQVSTDFVPSDGNARELTLVTVVYTAIQTRYCHG